MGFILFWTSELNQIIEMYFIIEVQLLYNIVLLSGVQHSYLGFFCKLYCIIIYYSMLARIAYAVQLIFVAYLFYIEWFVSANPIFLIYSFPFPLSFGSHKFVFSVSSAYPFII